MEIHNLWEAFIEAARNEGFFYWSELLAVIMGIFYVVLAARGNSWCWLWGIGSSLLWAYAAYVLFDLYIDALLQLFYVVMGAVGWYQWRQGGTEKQGLPITKLTQKDHVLIIVGGLFLSFILGYLFAAYTPAAATYLDAFTTVFSIAATFMVVQKKIDNWLYWIVIDVVYCYLYTSRGGYLFATLFVIYTIIAIIGFLNWQKQAKKEEGG